METNKPDSKDDGSSQGTNKDDSDQANKSNEINETNEANKPNVTNETNKANKPIRPNVTNETNDVEVSWAPKRPDKFTWKKFIFDKEKKTILRRTKLSWFKIMLFFCIFYTCVFIFFYIYFKIWMYLRIDPDRPHYIFVKSIRFSFQPNINSDIGKKITYNKNSNFQPLTNKINEFLQPYLNVIDFSNMGGCTAANNYGYAEGKPCIFFKLNKVFDYTPDYYEDSNELPGDMPIKLKNAINQVNEKDKIWLSCEGKTQEDKNLLGDYDIFPQPGFSNAKTANILDLSSHLIPPIAIQLTEPALNNLIVMNCRIWAKNIEYDEDENGVGHLTIRITIND